MQDVSPLPWTARRLFEELRSLSPLRVISVCGPSIFETICRFDAFGIHGGWLLAITPDYHWHLEVERTRFFRTRDEVHERSGRRVLFVELFDEPDGEPFLSIYLHRDKDAELEPARLQRFAALHARASAGLALGEEAA